MNNWIKLTPHSISDYLCVPQLDALRQNKDALETIISDIVAQVRGIVASNPKNEMPERMNLIPVEVKAPTCFLIIEALQSRIPTVKLSEDQVRNADNARAYLKRVAEGSVSISKCHEFNGIMPRGSSSKGRKRQLTIKHLYGL